LANAKDVANWLGISFPSNAFNFHPSVRPVPLEIHIQGFDHNNKQTRVLAMMRPAYNELKKSLHHTTNSQAIVFVSDRKQARLSALDIITFSASDETPKRFLGVPEGSAEIKTYLKDIEA
jgi:pre-mRNA-splicing helicase BRR2